MCFIQLSLHIIKFIIYDARVFQSIQSIRLSDIKIIITEHDDESVISS